MKKQLLTIGAIVTATTPIAGTLACSKGGKNETSKKTTTKKTTTEPRIANIGKTNSESINDIKNLLNGKASKLITILNDSDVKVGAIGISDKIKIIIKKQITTSKIDDVTIEILKDDSDKKILQDGDGTSFNIKLTKGTETLTITNWKVKRQDLTNEEKVAQTLADKLNVGVTLDAKTGDSVYTKAELTTAIKSKMSDSEITALAGDDFKIDIDTLEEDGKIYDVIIDITKSGVTAQRTIKVTMPKTKKGLLRKHELILATNKATQSADLDVFKTKIDTYNNGKIDIEKITNFQEMNNVIKGTKKITFKYDNKEYKKEYTGYKNEDFNYAKREIIKEYKLEADADKAYGRATAANYKFITNLGFLEFSAKFFEIQSTEINFENAKEKAGISQSFIDFINKYLYGSVDKLKADATILDLPITFIMKEEKDVTSASDTIAYVSPFNSYQSEGIIKVDKSNGANLKIALDTLALENKEVKKITETNDGVTKDNYHIVHTIDENATKYGIIESALKLIELNKGDIVASKFSTVLNKKYLEKNHLNKNDIKTKLGGDYLSQNKGIYYNHDYQGNKIYYFSRNIANDKWTFHIVVNFNGAQFTRAFDVEFKK